jgi:hypothetical protein
MKDGTQKVLSLAETNKSISEGKIERILDANIPHKNNPNNPLNRAWSISSDDEFKLSGVSYTDKDFIEFMGSKDGYEFIEKYNNFVLDVNLTAGGWALGESASGLLKLADNSIFLKIYNGSEAILKNGFYEVNGFKFSKYYYEKLWSTGRGAPGLIAKEVVKGAKNPIPDTLKKGFLKYEFGNWEMVYNPKTKEVWHLQPTK